MSFLQDPPRLGNQFNEDRVLRSLLGRLVPEDVRRDIEPSLERMGGLAAGRLYELARECRLEEPEHVPYDPWGVRVDEVPMAPHDVYMHKVITEKAIYQRPA